MLGQWGIGWTPSYYEFLSDNPVLTRLNLKASYGYTANLNGVSVSSTVATFAYSTNSYEDQRPLDLMGLYNKDLKPEQTKSIDAGINIGLFDRITFRGELVQPSYRTSVVGCSDSVFYWIYYIET